MLLFHRQHACLQHLTWTHAKVGVFSAAIPVVDFPLPGDADAVDLLVHGHLVKVARIQGAAAVVPGKLTCTGVVVAVHLVGVAHSDPHVTAFCAAKS